MDKANPRPANKFGHILEIVEDGGDHTGTRFRWEILVLGGDPKDASHGAYYQGRTDVSPLAVPDNFAFDDQGRLWVATDGMDDTLGPNDAVFMVDAEGPLRGRCLQFLSAPTGCEVCGPAFTPDNRTFFVAIQHPGLTDKATYAESGKPLARPPAGHAAPAERRRDLPDRRREGRRVGHLRGASQRIGPRAGLRSRPRPHRRGGEARPATPTRQAVAGPGPAGARSRPLLQ